MFPHHSKLSCQKLCSVSFRHGTIRHIRGNARFLNFKFSVSILLLLHASSSMIVSVSSSVQVDSLATVSDFILSGFIHWHMCLFAQPPGCVFPVSSVQYQNLCEKTFRPQARQWGYRRRPRCQVANIWMFKTWGVWGNISSILTYHCLHLVSARLVGFGLHLVPFTLFEFYASSCFHKRFVIFISHLWIIIWQGLLSGSCPALSVKMSFRRSITPHPLWHFGGSARQVCHRWNIRVVVAVQRHRLERDR